MGVLEAEDDTGLALLLGATDIGGGGEELEREAGDVVGGGGGGGGGQVLVELVCGEREEGE